MMQIKTLEADEGNTPSEVYLWLAVLERAILDLKSNSKPCRNNAKYFFQKSKWFFEVCSMVGIDPDYLRKQVKTYA